MGYRIPIMEKHLPLDTTTLKTAYSPQALVPHEKYGVGEVYQFGPTRVELYLGTDEVSARVRILMSDASLGLLNVSQVKPSQDGGLLIDCARQGQKPHCTVNINNRGEIAFLYSPPASMQISESGQVRRFGGREFTQSTIDIEGTPEGVKVQIRGTVDAAPRLIDTKNQRSPLAFFLIEDNPTGKPVYHEVWAINKPKQELKALKLVKGTLIEAILFRHTYEAELVSGKKVTVTRHNLVKVIYVEGRRHSAQRQRKEQ
jgi:hypothetical protein